MIIFASPPSLLVDPLGEREISDAEGKTCCCAVMEMSWATPTGVASRGVFHGQSCVFVSHLNPLLWILFDVELPYVREFSRMVNSV